MQPDTHNCHYISRFLTRPWEFGQRMLRFYDFDTDRFGVSSSRTMFSGEKLNTPEPLVLLWWNAAGAVDARREAEFVEGTCDELPRFVHELDEVVVHRSQVVQQGADTSLALLVVQRGRDHDPARGRQPDRPPREHPAQRREVELGVSLDWRDEERTLDVDRKPESE